jgi:hypothetical protein
VFVETTGGSVTETGEGTEVDGSEVVVEVEIGGEERLGIEELDTG